MPPHFLLIFTIFQRENLQDNGNISTFAFETAISETAVSKNNIKKTVKL